MRRSLWRQASGLLLLAALSACGNKSTTVTSGSTTPTTLSSVAISGNTTFTDIGQNSQLTATATFSDGTTQNVTPQATWQSSSTIVATVSASGLLAVTGFGDATVQVTYQGKTATAQLHFNLDMTGTWKGNASDSSGSSQITTTLTQNGTAFSGSINAVNNLGVPTNGSFTGTITGSGVTATFSISASDSAQTCTLTVSGTGQITKTTFTGTYAGNKTCFGPVTNGQFSFVRQ